MIKTKGPPTKGADVLALLKLTKSRQTSGYASQLANVMNFLNITRDIRTGAEVVETDLTIDQVGSIQSVKEVRRDYLHDRMRKFEGTSDEIHGINSEIGEVRSGYGDLHKIIYSKAKVNTEEKKEKARAKITEMDEATAVLRKKKEEIIAAQKQELETAEYPIAEMREALKLFAGVKIRVQLQTGTYSFPVPLGPVYREVCNLLGLPLSEPDAVAEKPHINRMFTLPAECLDAIKKAQKFTSSDDLRPAMTCVCLEFDNNFLKVVATDAHRVFMSPAYEVSGPPGKYVYLLPRGSLQRLPKTLKEDYFPFYELKDGKVSFLDTTVELVDARFPDYKCVVPEYETGITFDRKSFVSAVKQVLPFTNKSTSQVAIDINGEMIFAAQDIDFSFEGGVRMRYLSKSMPDTQIAFNGKFMVETMSIFKTDEIQMLSEGAPTKAGIFTDGIDRVLIMPLMLNGY